MNILTILVYKIVMGMAIPLVLVMGMLAMAAATVIARVIAFAITTMKQ